MERDFMGLNIKDSLVVVKEEPVESCKDSGLRWSLSSKVGVPHFMSLNSAQDENTFKALSATDGVNAGLKRQSGELQNVHAMHLPYDVKMLPFNMNNPSYKTHFGGTGQMNQILGGIPVTAPHSMLPSRGSVAGTTEPWFNSKGSAAPAQLTIFYGGTVNVFDDISPEKAQAIMFLAGNGCAPPNVVQPRFQLQASASKPAAADGACVNQTPNMLPASGLSSPMSVSSHPIGQSDGTSGNKDDMKICTTANISMAPLGTLETPKIVTSLGPVGASTIMPAGMTYRSGNLEHICDVKTCNNELRSGSNYFFEFFQHNSFRPTFFDSYHLRFLQRFHRLGKHLWLGFWRSGRKGR